MTTPLASFGKVETAFLVDACASGAPAGTVHRFDVSAQPLPKSSFGVSLAQLPRNLPFPLAASNARGVAAEWRLTFQDNPGLRRMKTGIGHRARLGFAVQKLVRRFFGRPKESGKNAKTAHPPITHVGARELVARIP
jgi:hypothetical protein